MFSTVKRVNSRKETKMYSLSSTSRDENHGRKVIC